MDEVGKDPVLWHGYRNNGYSLFKGLQATPVDNGEDLAVRVFPNPATQGEVKIRVENYDSSISLRIFDIAGNQVFLKNYTNVNNQIVDLHWDTRGIATGVYYGIIKSGGSSRKVPIAIIN